MGQLSGPTDPAADARWEDQQPRKGFFTDTSICIGCKACEVACKEWNHNPHDGNLELLGSSYDNTGALGASTWRHVAFVEQGQERITEARESGRALVNLGMPGIGPPPTATSAGADLANVDTRPPDTADFRWLMSSDVCKHCTHAGCLDVCPTGALFRTEFGTVVVQEDVCNGCGYCVPACPYGVIDRRESDGRVWKCTLCYDRLKSDKTPACAQACPTHSIQFGELDELRERADVRLEQLVEAGQTDAQLYLRDEADGVNGAGAFFLLLDEPEVYGLPPDPVDTVSALRSLWGAAAAATVALGFGIAAAAFGGRR